MKQRSRRRSAVRAPVGMLALLAAALACGGRDTPPADSPRAAATPAPSSSAAAGDPRRPACPRTGHWAECHVRERLIRSGFAPRDTTREALPTLGPAPAIYRLGRGALAVYLFDDSLARGRAAARLDSVKYVRASRGPTVTSEAMVIENDNLLALLFSKNDQQIERVSDALTAGAPQP